MKKWPSDGFIGRPVGISGENCLYLEPVSAGLVVSLVYADVAATDFLLVESGYSRARRISALHFHEAEALGLTAVLIDDHVDTIHFAVRREEALEIILGGVLVHVSYIDFVGHTSSLFRNFRFGCMERRYTDETVRCLQKWGTTEGYRYFFGLVLSQQNNTSCL